MQYSAWRARGGPGPRARPYAVGAVDVVRWLHATCLSFLSLLLLPGWVLAPPPPLPSHTLHALPGTLSPGRAMGEVRASARPPQRQTPAHPCTPARPPPRVRPSLVPGAGPATGQGAAAQRLGAEAAVRGAAAVCCGRRVLPGRAVRRAAVQAGRRRRWRPGRGRSAGCRGSPAGVAAFGCQPHADGAGWCLRRRWSLLPVRRSVNLKAACRQSGESNHEFKIKPRNYEPNHGRTHHARLAQAASSAAGKQRSSVRTLPCRADYYYVMSYPTHMHSDGSASPGTISAPSMHHHTGRGLNALLAVSVTVSLLSMLRVPATQLLLRPHPHHVTRDSHTHTRRRPVGTRCSTQGLELALHTSTRQPSTPRVALQPPAAQCSAAAKPTQPAAEPLKRGEQEQDGGPGRGHDGADRNTIRHSGRVRRPGLNACEEHLA